MVVEKNLWSLVKSLKLRWSHWILEEKLAYLIKLLTHFEFFKILKHDKPKISKILVKFFSKPSVSYPKTPYLFNPKSRRDEKFKRKLPLLNWIGKLCLLSIRNNWVQVSFSSSSLSFSPFSVSLNVIRTEKRLLPWNTSYVKLTFWTFETSKNFSEDSPLDSEFETLEDVTQSRHNFPFSIAPLHNTNNNHFNINRRKFSPFAGELFSTELF